MMKCSNVYFYKILFAILFMLGLMHLAPAQNGMEWIVPDQNYYKIKTYTDGVYAIPYTQLQAAGLSTMNLANLQLWHRGKEQAIYITNDSVFFYGKRNDGTLDSLLYGPLQPHKYYNLLSDTCAYFLTNGSANGKRINLTTQSASTIDPWYLHQELVLYNNKYYRGKQYSETTSSAYDEGEGWFGDLIIKSTATPVYKEISIPVSNGVSVSTTIQLEMQVCGVSNSAHKTSLLIGSQNSPDFTFAFNAYSNQSLKSINVTIPSSYLAGKAKLTCYIKVEGTGITDVIAPSFIRIVYPRSYVGITDPVQKLILSGNGNVPRTVVMANALRPVWIIDNTDPYTQQLINFNFQSNQTTFNVPAQTRQVLVYNDPFKSVSSLKKIDFTLPVLNASYYVVYADLFKQTAENFRSYRSSPAGGGYTSYKVSFDELCDLYAYGEFTPVALKRFCSELNTTATKKFMLILGKGVSPGVVAYFEPNVFYYRTNPNAFWTAKNRKFKLVNLIPTYGDPGSDLLYSANNKSLFQIYTGRVAARTKEEADGYLNKVRTHEALDSNILWRKNLVHLSGGKTSAEVATFKGNVDRYKAIVEGKHFGGKVVKTYVKNLQNGPVDDQLKLNIADRVNEGLSMITFFGHSSNEVIDVDIGEVSNPVYGYDNAGKYPVLLVNGCSSADIFSTYSFAEDWIITPGLGAINVIGHADIGYSANLDTYSTIFYTFQFKDERYRNMPIGVVHQKVADSIITYKGGIINIAMCLQMNLSGDPASRIYPNTKADYAIYGDEETSTKRNKCVLVADNGNFITAKDPFKIIIPVDNYGKTTDKTVELIIQRYVDNNPVAVKSYQMLVNPIFYQDTIIYSIPNNDGNYAGTNRFVITIDYADSLAEMRENNNVAVLSYYMPLSIVKCLYPVNYSVVFEQPITLIAQPTDLLMQEKEYYFEIDTSKSFNSTFKQSGSVLSGSLPSWSPVLISNVLPSDSIVYFWRVRFKNIQASEDTIWDHSSFIYIKNSNPGWSQTKIDQFLENELDGMHYDKTLNKWLFSSTSVDLHVQSMGGTTNNGRPQTELALNNFPFLTNTIYNSCNNIGLLVMVIDKSSLKPKKLFVNADYYYCGQNFDTKYVANFGALGTANNAVNFAAFINSADENDYILILNNGYSAMEHWHSDLKNYFKNTLHANNIISLNDGKKPFVLLIKRSLPKPIIEKYNTSNLPGSLVSADTTLTGFYNSGSITTSLIGPSSKWGKMYFAIDSTLDAAMNDSTVLKMIRYDVAGHAIDTIRIPKKDSLDLNGVYLIDGVHAYCKLMLEVTDRKTLTPAAIKKWQVIYNPVPEGSLNPYAVGLDNYKVQGKQEGDTLTVRYRFDNISDADFTQPLKVVFTIRNESGGLKTDTMTYTTLAAKQNMVFVYKVSTKGLLGKNYLQAYVNPQIQAEQYYSNNVLETIFHVELDKTQPVLEVSFDGVRIFDGDLVSASPLIHVSLRDENQYLLMKETNSIELYILYPNETVPKAIEYNDPMVQSWNLENARNNTFVAEIKPSGLPDGTYTLIVQGKDASGNRSGSNKYQIKFTIENKPSVTYFYPYPNPFSTSTRFVFTLTGTTVPDNIKIQIMTVSGKIVKEIFKEQLGNLHIGNNISEYAWDGTDEYGDRLANGVYLYRVIIKDSGDYFEHRSNAGDRAFHKDWGKLYILR